MALQASGAITLAQVQAEFGGANPISLSEYYGAASGVPASGSISLSHFYGKSAYHSTSRATAVPMSKTTGIYTNTSWTSTWTTTWTTTWTSHSGCQSTQLSRQTSVSTSAGKVRQTTTSWTTSWNSTRTTTWSTYWK